MKTFKRVEEFSVMGGEEATLEVTYKWVGTVRDYTNPVTGTSRKIRTAEVVAIKRLSGSKKAAAVWGIGDRLSISAKGK
jgi:hypothetical protein